ncbi:hypothetical protein Barb4_05400 [Bacteroidales bacterium Barb4]|nr:hypothetical protein Barb4_05400 [Bacteroidales bacterium Barb4]
MWGYGRYHQESSERTIQNATYNIRSFFQNLRVIALLTPHSATLHVGLKSPVLSGRLRNNKLVPISRFLISNSR